MSSWETSKRNYDAAVEIAAQWVARARSVIAAGAVCLGAVGCADSGKADLPLRPVADVPLSGTSSRFDYQSLDQAASRLYVSHLADGAVVVVDVARRRLVTTIGGVPGVHGVLVVPRLHRVFAAATDAHELVTIREQTGDMTRRTRAGRYPDGIAFDAERSELFVSDESGGVEVVIDARTGRRVGSVPLGGGAGNVQYDPASRRILVDIQTRDELGIIDPRRRRVVARYPLAGCDHDHGLHLDPARRLAFIACDGNARLLVFDLRRMRVIGRAPVGAGPDVLDFDPVLHRLYVAAESGVVTVFAERGRGLRELGRGFLAENAHSVAVDPRTHLVYFPLRDIGGRPVLRIMAPT
jgi:DNA-binding beta-propeller fold protein YncE